MEPQSKKQELEDDEDICFICTIEKKWKISEV